MPSRYRAEMRDGVPPAIQAWTRMPIRAQDERADQNRGGATCRGGDPGSARIGGDEPAVERVTTDDGDLAVGGDPVPHAQFAHEPERIVGSGTVAVRGERVAARLDRPAIGLQRSQRQSLLVGGEIKRMWPGVAERILAGTRLAWPRGRRGGRAL